MSMKWTQEQQNAITTDKSSILVSAAAGSGKTAVLVERIIRNITDEKNPSDINQFLISTFTKAAADEMREKISVKILDLIEKNPKSRHFKKQLALIYDADINTVHGVCADLIRNNFSILDIAPNFSLFNEDSASLIKKQVMEDTLGEFYDSEENKNFILALETFWIKRDDKAFSRLVLELYEKIVALPFFEDWLDWCKQKYEVNLNSDLFLTQFGEIIKIDIQKMLNAYLKNYLSIKEDIVLDCTFKTVFFDELEFINKLLNQDISFDEMQRIINDFKFITFPRAKKDTDPFLAMRYKKLRDAFKAEIKARKEDYFRGNSQYWLEDISKLRPVIDGLFEVLTKFSQNYKNIKNDKNMLDFNDLEHLALKLLIVKDAGEYKKTDVAKKLSQKYKEIFIDEYQDINGIQDLIFFALSNDSKNLFMVGDIKQSIYRFRQADPTIFLNKYSRFSDDLNNLENKKIMLGKNFRSRGATLDVINAVFENVMNEYIGEISYTNDEFLYKNDLYPDEKNPIHNPELAILDYSNISYEEGQADLTEGQEDSPKDDLSKLQKEAVFVAQRIKSMMDEGFLIFDAKIGEQRPLEYRDIAILLRSTTGKDKIFEDILNGYDIPVLCNTKSEYFQNSDVLLMLSLLKVVDNSRQDIELLAVMRSPIFSFSEDDILELRLKYQDGDIYDMVSNASMDGYEKCEFMLDYINSARKKAQNVAVYELIMYLYESSGYFMMISGSKNPGVRKANLNTLYRLAKDFEQTQYKGIFNFINYVNNLIENKNDITVIKNDLDSLNSVKIMSIHKSKGLEFGVCFVCDTAKGFNKTDLRQSVVFHKDYGIGTDFRDFGRMIYYPTIAKLAIAEKMNLELLSEELRILYVALTRAKEKLIIVGSLKNIDRTCDRISSYDVSRAKLDPYFSSMAKNHLDFIIMGLGLYKIRGVEYDKKYSIDTLENSKLDFCVFDGNAMKVDIRQTMYAKAIKSVEKSENPYTELAKQRLEANYSFKSLKNIPIKLSVTELKGKVLDDELDSQMGENKHSTLKKPKFIEKQKGLDFAQRGSAMHMFMQFMDYSMVDSIMQVKEQADKMVSLKKLTTLQAEAIDFEKIKAFFDCDLATQMKHSKAVYREQRFNIGIDADRFFETGGVNNEKMLVQGVIDCFFVEEDNKAVLIDFKTDRIKKEDKAEFKNRYSLQLEIYKEAIEKIYGINVKTKIIYSFFLNEAIEV